MPDVHTLYVILQGEFVMFRERNDDPNKDDTLHIQAPYLDPHAYKAGPWRSDWYDEKFNLTDTPLELRYAVGDRKQKHFPSAMKHHPRAIPERNTDLLMSCGPEFPKLRKVDPRVRITAPVPLAILSGLAETAQCATITHTPPGGVASTRLAPPHAAVITILLYKWYGDERPYLADTASDRTWLTGGPSDDFQSIHIYASSPEEEDDPGHAKDAFKAAAHLLGEEASIDWPAASKFHRLAAIQPAGLKWAQVNLFFNEVLLLEGQHSPYLDADFVDVSKLSFWEPVHLGQSTNCGPVTGDDDGKDNN